MSNVKFKYFGDTSKAYTNVITVASELSYDKEKNNYLIKFGCAFSNKKDKYDKKIGKELALNRLVNKPCMFKIVNRKDFFEKPRYTLINRLILNYIEDEIDSIPEWFITLYGDKSSI